MQSEWQPIETAPRDRLIMLYGLLDPHPDDRFMYGGLDRPTRVTGYWDEIDEAWCPNGSTSNGPWFKPTHWAECIHPPQPKEQADG